MIDTRETVQLSEGEVVKLETVKLQYGDIGFRAVFMNNGEYKLFAKLLPLGVGKPKTKEEALKMLQGFVSMRPDMVVPYVPGMKIEYQP